MYSNCILPCKAGFVRHFLSVSGCNGILTHVLRSLPSTQKQHLDLQGFHVLLTSNCTASVSVQLLGTVARPSLLLCCYCVWPLRASVNCSLHQLASLIQDSYKSSLETDSCKCFLTRTRVPSRKLNCRYIRFMIRVT